MTKKPLHLKIVKGHSQKAACPLCQQPAEALHRPFCSRRCAQLDLGKWLNEDYRVPADEVMDEGDVDALIAELEKGKE